MKSPKETPAKGRPSYLNITALAISLLFLLWKFRFPAVDFSLFSSTPRPSTFVNLAHVFHYGHPDDDDAKSPLLGRLDISSEDSKIYSTNLIRRSLGPDSALTSLYESGELSLDYVITNEPVITIPNVYEEAYFQLDVGFLNAQKLHALKRRVPNVQDKATVLALAIMSNNAYEMPDSREWIPLTKPLDDGWKKNISFGFNTTGLRGHVFASEDKDLLVIALKGTSPSLFGIGAPTGKNDLFNDNRMFSCCCAKINCRWSSVCDCHKGFNSTTNQHKCSLECILDSVNYKNSFYNAAREIYSSVRVMYPDSQIWFVGHSLGGALASMMSLTTGDTAIGFESPGDRLYASRLGFKFDKASIAAANPHLKDNDVASSPVYHFGNSIDPVFVGKCMDGPNFCGLAGFALESKCHIGNKCTYQVGDSLNIQYHKISDVITKVIMPSPDVPPCVSTKGARRRPGTFLGDDDEYGCTDCDSYNYI